MRTVFVALISTTWHLHIGWQHFSVTGSHHNFRSHWFCPSLYSTGLPRQWWDAASTLTFNSSLFQVAASESNNWTAGYVSRATKSGEKKRLGQCSWKAEDPHCIWWHHSVRSFSLQRSGSFLHHPVTANPWNPLQFLQLLVWYTINYFAWEAMVSIFLP